MKTVKLSNVCEKIGSGATPRGGSEVYQSSGVALIRSQNVYNDGFRKEGLAYINDKHARELENVIVQAGDVLLNITDDSVARVCQVPKEVLPARVNQHVSIIRPHKDILDAKYLKFFLVSPLMQQYMNALAASGATRQALTKGMIEAYDIPAPPLPEQRAIASILGALDDKIVLNRKTNETLEAMARAIFKSWFVDFAPIPGFSPHKGWKDSTLGRIPNGWKVARVSEAFEINPSIQIKKGLQYAHVDMASLPTKSARVTNITRREFTGAGSKFKNGDVLFARITPCLENGKTALVDFLHDHEYGWGSTEFIVFRPKEPLNPWFVYCVARNQEFREHAIRAMSGTSGRQRVEIGCFNNFSIVLPPADIATIFGDIVKPWFTRMKANDEQSHILIGIRDALLPKLLSGEIRVKNAERFVEGEYDRI